jgi:predicted phosphoribosyltransferase
MQIGEPNIVYENRFDAGRKLAERLIGYRSKNVIVLAIPNGGLPVALQVALALDADLDLVISRKLPIPLRPEGGFGAVADDGTVMLNQDVVKSVGINQQQVNYQVQKVRNDVQQRSLIYRGSRQISVLTDKVAIIVDDGLASGYTMMAAVESVRRRKPAEIVAAVPAASEKAVKLLGKVADRVITGITSHAQKFYISDYYRYWNVLSDEEGLKCLKEWRIRKYSPKIKTSQKKREQ